MAYQPYIPSLIGLMVLVVIPMIQGFMAGSQKAAADVLPGSEPPGGYADRLYRVHRVYLNSTENLATMAVVVLVCLIVGARPWVVALLVWLHVLFRLGYWYVYLGNVGKTQGGTRSIVFALGWLMNLLLVVVAVAAAFGGPAG
jgi:uncharacterized MAPEG superfamily protein